MKLFIEIDMDNDSMSKESGYQIIQLQTFFDNIVALIDYGHKRGKLVDLNGNSAGERNIEQEAKG